MAYHYTDPKRESDPHALPDVEVFYDRAVACADCNAIRISESDDDRHAEECDSMIIRWEPAPGFYYAFGFPGCPWGSEPVGPFETETEALQAAREEGIHMHNDLSPEESADLANALGRPYITITVTKGGIRWLTNLGKSGAEPFTFEQAHFAANVMLQGFRLAGGGGEIIIDETGR